MIRTIALLGLVVAFVGSAAAAAFVYLGLYDVSSLAPHTQTVYSLMEKTMERSMRMRARDIEVPPLDDPALLRRGAACYQQKCVQCHGAPGVAPADIALGMQPVPGSLISATQRWHPGEIYLITRRGIKMSGMPAWEYRLSDEELWSLVAFVQRLPDLTTTTYAQTVAGLQGQTCGSSATLSVGAGSAERGRVAIHQYACRGCHVIPGVAGSDLHIGPPLQGIASRRHIAGRLPNTPEAMVAWIRHPRRIDPESAMPDVGVTEQDARDIAAYLATLH